MKKILLLTYTLLILTTLFGQEGDSLRSINWVHGFVGDETSWAQIENQITQDYNVISKRVYYPSFGGIDECAAYTIPQLSTEGQYPLVVAHSMGGLVTRKMCEMGANIGAYATFGTPHNGAHFAENYLNGNVGNFVSEFTEEVFVDVMEALFTPYLTALNGSLISMFEENDPYGIGKIIFKFIEFYVKNKTDDYTISDLKYKGSYVKNLANPQIPKVNFYGVEDSPVHWRFLGNFVDASANDDLLVDKMDQLYVLYETMFTISIATSSVCLSFPALFIPTCTLAGIYAGNFAGQLSQALHALDQSEAAWLALIGGIGGSYQDCYTDEQLIGWDYNGDDNYDGVDQSIRDSCLWSNLHELDSDSLHIELDVDCEGAQFDLGMDRRPDPCNDYKELYKDMTTCVDVFYGKRTDGLIVFDVTAEDDHYHWVEIPKMNHQQLKNNIKVRQQLSFLFDNKDVFSQEKFERFYIGN